MSKRLFVGGLPYSVTQDELQNMFSQHGSITSCSIITDKFTNQSKGFGFVEMENDAEADNAIKALDGTEVGGRKIAVNVARPREERSDSRGGGRGDYRGGGNDRRGGNDRGGYNRGGSRR